MKKMIASVVLVTAVAVGGLAVAAVNPIQLVSAKSSSHATTTSATATAAAKPARAGAKVLDQALAGLVDKGTITNAQAAQVKAAIRATAQKYRAEHKGVVLRRAVRRGVVKTSAKAIGITPKALVTEMKTGKSIAQVAQAKGVDPQTVVSAIVTAGNTKVDAAVTAGKIDAARAAKIEQRLPELATKAVNRVPRQRTN